MPYVTVLRSEKHSYLYAHIVCRYLYRGLCPLLAMKKEIAVQRRLFMAVGAQKISGFGQPQEFSGPVRHSRRQGISGQS